MTTRIPPDLNPSVAPDGDGPRRRRSDTYFIAAAATLAAIAIVVGAVLIASLGGDESTTTDGTQATSTSTSADTAPTSEVGSSTTAGSTTVVPSTTATSTTVASTAATTAPPTSAPGAITGVVWPDPDGTVRYDDPTVAARSFAEDFIGFASPVLSEFRQGDARSGEIVIQPTATGPETTVILRQAGSDDSWWVLGASTAHIVVDRPLPASTVSSPLTLSGQAWAFEGNVAVGLYVNGQSQPLAETNVTGGGDQLRAFEGTLEWTGNASGSGAIVFSTEGGADGGVWEVTVVPVSFGR